MEEFVRSTLERLRMNLGFQILQRTTAMLEHGKRYMRKNGEISGVMDGVHPACENNDAHQFYDGKWFYSSAGRIFPYTTPGDDEDIDFSWEVSQTYQPGDEYVGEGWFKRKVQKCFMRCKDWSIQFLETKDADVTLEFHAVWATECPAGYFPLEKLVEITK